MALYRTIPFVRHILEKHLHPQGYVIDATLGNGNDTLTCANLLGASGKIFGFDVQQQAIMNTRAKLEKNGHQCAIAYIHDSHEYLLAHLAEYVGKIDCVIFNLGYLPHADNQAMTTMISSTYKALLQAMILLKERGLLIVVTYPGHPSGLVEHQQLMQLFQKANPDFYFITTYYQMNHTENPPHIFLVEKRI